MKGLESLEHLARGFEARAKACREIAVERDDKTAITAKAIAYEHAAEITRAELDLRSTRDGADGGASGPENSQGERSDLSSSQAREVEGGGER